MLVAFSVSPTTTDAPDGSVSEAVARAVRVVRDSGLPHETTSMFTTIEGEWDECMDVVKRACEAVAEVSPRVALVLKADIRPGWTGQMSAKVERVEARLRQDGCTIAEDGGAQELLGLRPRPVEQWLKDLAVS